VMAPECAGAHGRECAKATAVTQASACLRPAP
jgi:hypothetical protein